MNIVVRGTNWIGDAVMTVPALRELRNAFPDARITLHSRPAAAEVFSDAEFIDEILLIKNTGSRVRNISDQVRELRRYRFEIGISLTNSIESAIVQKLAGVPRRFGYGTQWRRAFLTDPVPVPEWKDSRHEVYYYLNLIEEVERSLDRRSPGREGVPYPELTISGERRQKASEKLRDLGVTTAGPVVALGIGSTNSRAKRWPAARYAELAARLAGDLGANVILIGSDGDKPVAADVISLSGSHLIDLCGGTSVSEAAAILAECDLLISNDMGLAHLAPAVGTKTIAIFGPTNDITTGPFSNRAEVIRHNVECSPCMLRDCPIDHRCMTGVSVETVLANASGKLTRK